MSSKVNDVALPQPQQDGIIEETKDDENEMYRVQKIMEARTLVLERDEARSSNNYVKSDILRDKLKAIGVEVIDQKGGPSGWKFIDGSSKKLKAGSSVVMPSKKRPPEDSTTSNNNTDAQDKDNSSKKKKLKTTKATTATVDTKKTTSAASAPVKVSAETQRNQAALSSVLGVTAGIKNIQGVLIEDIKVGTGKKAESGKKVKVYYSGKLKTTGKVFDASLTKPFAFRLGRSEVIKGWDIGVAGMAVGGKRRITCPPEKAYGRVGAPPTIPSNATLIFEVTLLEVI